MKVYRFVLRDALTDDLIMSTEVDEFNPLVDLELRDRFAMGDCYIVFTGESEESEENGLDDYEFFGWLLAAYAVLNDCEVIRDESDEGEVWLRVPRTEWENYTEKSND